MKGVPPPPKMPVSPSPKVTKKEQKFAQSMPEMGGKQRRGSRVSSSMSKTLRGRRPSHKKSMSRIEELEDHKGITIPHKAIPANFDTTGFIPRIYIPKWSDVKGACSLCSLTKTSRHNCRLCGQWVCANCSQKIYLPKTFAKKAHKSGPRRVCTPCEKVLIDGAVMIGKDPPAKYGSIKGSSSHQGTLCGYLDQMIDFDDKMDSKVGDEEKWIACTEVVSGKKLWYKEGTMEIRFIPPSKKLPDVPPEFIETKPGWFFDVETGEHKQFYPDDLLEEQEQGLYQKIDDFLKPCLKDWELNNEEFDQIKTRFREHPRWSSMKSLVPNHFEHAFPQFLYKNSLDTKSLPQDQNILIQVKCVHSMHKGNSQTTMRNSIGETVGSVIEAAVKKLKFEEPNKDINNYMLKAIGREEYLATLDMPLSAFRLVVESIKRGDRVLKLKLVFRPTDIDPPRNLLKLEQTKPGMVKEKVFDSRDFIAEGTETVIQKYQLNTTLRLKIHEVDNICGEIIENYDQTLYTYLFVRVELFHGEERIWTDYEMQTGAVCCRRQIAFDQVIEPELRRETKSSQPPPQFSTLPLETRLAIQLYGYKGEKDEVLLAHVNIMLADQSGKLRQGRYMLPMWSCVIPTKENRNVIKEIPSEEYAVLGPIVPNRKRGSKEECVRIGVEFDVFEHPVVCHSSSPVSGGSLTETKETRRSKQVDKMLATIKSMDALCTLKREQKELVWLCRRTLMTDPMMLPRFLLCVDWTDRSKANEARRCMEGWAKISPYQALELLSHHYADYAVRLYAVNRLRILGDDELREVLLQITQLLKFEPYHDSPLARFVMERALANPYGVGHFFFWHLKAELHNRDSCERFYCLLATYLAYSQRHMRELQLQHKMISRFEFLADKLVRMKRDERKDKSYCKSWLQDQLKKLVFPSRLQLTLDPSIQATCVLPKECKFMSSKKLPLWLVFENVDQDASPKKIFVIFKSGDDLRQDILTLQMLRLMDAFWRAKGIDLELSPYTCVATGVNKDEEGVGMIEVVLNSDTISHIQIEYGGVRGGAFDNTTLDKYLREKSIPTGKKIEDVKETFIKSTAGYCVATYNLGIGDRHNGNIMLTKTGKLFHIDFGHFLGNFKQKMGFKRERSPFVFTKEMAYVMGGDRYDSSERYKRFVKLCCEAYNIIRANGHLFITLFRTVRYTLSMMVVQ